MYLHDAFIQAIVYYSRDAHPGNVGQLLGAFDKLAVLGWEIILEDNYLSTGMQVRLINPQVGTTRIQLPAAYKGADEATVLLTRMINDFRLSTTGDKSNCTS